MQLQSSVQTAGCCTQPQLRKRAKALTPAAQLQQQDFTDDTLHIRKRHLLSLAAATASLPIILAQPAFADDFVTTGSGLRYLDIKEGTGKQPKAGDVCVVHWSGYTKGYQGKRIDNTSVRDEPYEFVLGGGTTIQAFEEAVATMKVGGVRRVEVPGEKETLGYPRDRNLRFTEQSPNGKFFVYRFGPQPVELGGQRALDFVLDNPTLRDFNRDLLFDIKLLSVRQR